MEQELINDLKNWIKTFLAKPQAELSDLPVCPYAKPTLDNNTIRFKFVYDDLEEHLLDLGRNWTDEDSEGKVEIIAILTPTENYSEEEVADITEAVNDELMPLDIVILDDHPDREERIGELVFNFGKCILCLMARLSVLNHASTQLAKNTDYYKKWPKDYLEWVTLWRFENVTEDLKKLMP